MVTGPEGQGQASVSAGLPQPGDQRWSEGRQQDAWAPYWEAIGADLFTLAMEREGDGGLESPWGASVEAPALLAASPAEPGGLEPG